MYTRYAENTAAIRSRARRFERGPWSLAEVMPPHLGDDLEGRASGASVPVQLNLADVRECPESRLPGAGASRSRTGLTGLDETDDTWTANRSRCATESGCTSCEHVHEVRMSPLAHREKRLVACLAIACLRRTSLGRARRPAGRAGWFSKGARRHGGRPRPAPSSAAIRRTRATRPGSTAGRSSSAARAPTPSTS